MINKPVPLLPDQFEKFAAECVRLDWPLYNIAITGKKDMTDRPDELLISQAEEKGYLRGLEAAANCCRLAKLQRREQADANKAHDTETQQARWDAGSVQAKLLENDIVALKSHTTLLTCAVSHDNLNADTSWNDAIDAAEKAVGSSSCAARVRALRKPG